MRSAVLLSCWLGLLACHVCADEMKEAQAAFQQQKYARAVELLDVYIPQHPVDMRAMSLRGRALVTQAEEVNATRRGDPEATQSVDADANRAIADLTQAIEAGFGGNGMPYFYRARAYFLRLGQGEADSLADFNKAIELNPKQADRYYFRGLLYQRFGDSDAAFADFHQCLGLDPKNEAAYRERAHTQHGRGLQIQYSQRETNGVTYIVGTITGIRDREKLVQALADYDRALAIDPADLKCRVCRRDICSQLGDAEKCLAEARELCSRQPENAAVWQELAKIRACHPSAEFRNGKEAMEAALKACELSHNQDPEALLVLGSAYAEAKRFKKAVEATEQALALTSKPPEGEATVASCSLVSREECESRLALYRDKKPWHDPKLQDVSGSPAE